MPKIIRVITTLGVNRVEVPDLTTTTCDQAKVLIHAALGVSCSADNLICLLAEPDPQATPLALRWPCAREQRRRRMRKHVAEPAGS